ncbi:MAG: GGDEF domain-containing protein [Clostridiales bacterium]|nr:GGDEF domain-containing protein [Clostridiales bacterium]
MKLPLRKTFAAWQYYTIGHDAYIKCVEREYANNLTNMILGGIIFSIFMIFATVNWSHYGATAAIMFPSLAAASALFAAASIYKYRQHRGGKIISKKLLYAMTISAYAVIMAISIYIDVMLSPTAVSIIFMTLLAGSVLFLPAVAMLSLLFNLGVLVVHAAITFSVVNPECCWICELAPATFGVVVGVSFAWYVNMHKMVATHSKIELEKERDQYLAQSTMDELTKLANRRAFMQKFKRYMKSGRDRDNFLCCAIIDIDYFKYYNDHYGHVAGDECLRKIGEALSEPFEAPSAYAARVGGEEFAMIWFSEKKHDGKNIILQLLKRIKGLDIPHEKSEAAQHVTVSIGAYVAPFGMHDNQDIIYNFADKMLYEAKEGGRNRAVVLDENDEKYSITL